jgi:hypothetical protein
MCEVTVYLCCELAYEKLYTQSKELGPLQRKSHLKNYTKSLYMSGLWAEQIGGFSTDSVCCRHHRGDTIYIYCTLPVSEHNTAVINPTHPFLTNLYKHVRQMCLYPVRLFQMLICNSKHRTFHTKEGFLYIKSQIRERSISLRFLGIILKVLRLEVSIWISFKT